MCEMIVPLIGVNKNIEKVLKMAEEDGYITTNTMSDIEIEELEDAKHE